nr:uncharacterized protein LOC125634872 [Caretta caretta]
MEAALSPQPPVAHQDPAPSVSVRSALVAALGPAPWLDSDRDPRHQRSPAPQPTSLARHRSHSPGRPASLEPPVETCPRGESPGAQPTASAPLTLGQKQHWKPERGGPPPQRPASLEPPVETCPRGESPGAQPTASAPLTLAPRGETLSPVPLDSQTRSMVEVQLPCTPDTFAAARDLIAMTASASPQPHAKAPGQAGPDPPVSTVGRATAPIPLSAPFPLPLAVPLLLAVLVVLAAPLCLPSPVPVLLCLPVIVEEQIPDPTPISTPVIISAQIQIKEPFHVSVLVQVLAPLPSVTAPFPGADLFGTTMALMFRFSLFGIRGRVVFFGPSPFRLYLPGVRGWILAAAGAGTRSRAQLNGRSGRPGRTTRPRVLHPGLPDQPHLSSKCQRLPPVSPPWGARRLS